MKQHSKDKLAEALRVADLPEMADRAAQGYYHDFLSPLETPCIQLDRELTKAGTPSAMLVRIRHRNGEFDATLEESEAWAASPAGQAAYGMLADALEKRRKK